MLISFQNTEENVISCYPTKSCCPWLKEESYSLMIKNISVTFNHWPKFFSCQFCRPHHVCLTNNMNSGIEILRLLTFKTPLLTDMFNHYETHNEAWNCYAALHSNIIYSLKHLKMNKYISESQGHVFYMSKAKINSPWIIKFQTHTGCV